MGVADTRSGYHGLMPLTITEALRLAAASQLLLVVGLLLRDHRRSRVTAASSLLVACVVCYLALPVMLQPAIPEVLRQLARAGALAVPFAFWLTARLYFDDSFQPKPVHGAFLLGLLGARALVVPWPLAAAAIGMAVVVDALRHILAGPSLPEPAPALRDPARDGQLRGATAARGNARARSSQSIGGSGSRWRGPRPVCPARAGRCPSPFRCRGQQLRAWERLPPNQPRHSLETASPYLAVASGDGVVRSPVGHGIDAAPPSARALAKRVAGQSTWP